MQALIDRGEVTTLEELNAALRIWLDGYYHAREHSSTKQSPKARFEASERPRKRKPLEELSELFLWEEARSVDKTGCIQLSRNIYEVDSALAGKRISLRYDPFDLTKLQVWYEDKRYADAVPLEMTRRRSRTKQEQLPTEMAEAPEESLSFLELAEKKRQAAWQEDTVQYARRKGGERA
ncbi:Mu transposase C-terminal domain-containing protein [Paenibacillus sabuli]|uniref:Mu transposase C-terminal domain-containing protein n=1 Tax=Paenibacillus sabuli TaxID=2772509 RepID=UPI00295C2B75|nr:Mu transposase C-terminal domain-containing protein [Paenibacillus sabuli]